jgi:hypothetical protein
MLALALLAVSFGTIAVLNVLAMNWLHKADPSHSPFGFNEGPYSVLHILLGYVGCTAGAAAFAALAWGLGHLIADGRSFALCALLLANGYICIHSVGHFSDFIRLRTWSWRH